MKINDYCERMAEAARLAQEYAPHVLVLIELTPIAFRVSAYHRVTQSHAERRLGFNDLERSRINLLAEEVKKTVSMIGVLLMP